MKTERLLIGSLVVAVLVTPAAVNAQDPVGSAFTYQGRLTDAGSAANGTYDMRFLLFDAPEGGAALDTFPDTGVVAVDVQDGLFSLPIEFDGALFDGNRRWLEIVVDGICLSPRQELTATPYALYALNGDEGFSLPFEGEVETSQTAFSVTNLGSGKTAYLRNFASDNGNPTLWVQHNGLGQVGYFLTYNTDSSNSTLLVDNYGLARSGRFKALNSSNAAASLEGSTVGSGPGVWGYTTGSGPAVKGQTNGTGNAGYFWIHNSANDQGAVLAETEGEGGRAVVGEALDTANTLNYGGYFRAQGGPGVGVYGKATRVGYFTNYGGYFEAAGNTGIGVLGQATAIGDAWNYGGYFNTAATYGTGVCARATGSYGVGIHAEGGSSGYAAELDGDVDVAGHLDVDGRISMQRDEADDSGWICVSGANLLPNVQITNLLDWPNSGCVAVYNPNGDWQAMMYVDGVYGGVVVADIKNFRTPNPSQPDTEIWYACLEGPEAAAYVRGTGHLTNGRAEVVLPDHFVAVAGPQGMTVQLTPLSAASKGLAVVEKHADGFVVRELFDGTGTYDFDYTVTAVRKGYEDYRVIRPASEALPAQPAEIDQGTE